MNQSEIKTFPEPLRQALLARLQRAEGDALDGRLTGLSGLCNYLNKDTECRGTNGATLRAGLFRTWDRFSGSTAYPVPAPANLSDLIREESTNWDNRSMAERVDDGFYSAVEKAEVAYDYIPLWEGEALALRVSLIRHMIAELQASLA